MISFSPKVSTAWGQFGLFCQGFTVVSKNTKKKKNSLCGQGIHRKMGLFIYCIEV